MTLLASISFVNSIMIEDVVLFITDFVSYPTYLISAVRMNALLLSSMSCIISLGLSMSIVLVRMPCTITPNVGIRTVALFPIPFV
jgi:hypothetical protein